MELTNTFSKIVNLGNSPMKIVQGGQGASKTISILQIWIIKAQRSNKKQYCNIVSATFPHLRDGAMKDFIEICERDNISHLHNKSDHTFIINKWIFRFFAVDKEHKSRGGRRDRLFLNEANGIPWEIARHLIGRTHGETIIDFNPEKKFWAHTYFIDPKNCSHLTVTYKDNHVLPKNEIDRIEMYAPWGSIPNENFWRVYGEGKLGFTEGTIFHYQTFKEPRTSSSMLAAFGLDFGWTDPLAFVRVDFDKKRKHLYWQELVYERNLKYSNLALFLKNHKKYNKNFHTICDSADPRSIMVLRQYAWMHRFWKANKTKIAVGIRQLNQYKIFVHEDSKNLLEEMNDYTYKKVGDYFTDEPQMKSPDHAIDACRYASQFLTK